MSCSLLEVELVEKHMLCFIQLQTLKGLGSFLLTCNIDFKRKLLVYAIPLLFNQRVLETGMEADNVSKEDLVADCIESIKVPLKVNQVWCTSVAVIVDSWYHAFPGKKKRK